MRRASAKKQGKLSKKPPSKAYLAMMQAFRKNTRVLRARRGWTTRQFAAEADISQTWVYYIERTEKPVSFAQMVNVAESFGIPVTAMLVDAFDDHKPRKES